MFHSENVLEEMREIGGLTRETAWKKTQLCFYYGVVMAKESFVTFGGNVYLQPEDFDIDFLSPRMRWAFRIGSIMALPVHVMAAIFGIVFFLCAEIAWPLLKGLGYLVVGLGSMAAETLTPYMSHQSENSRVIAPVLSQDLGHSIEQKESSSSRAPSPKSDPIGDSDLSRRVAERESHFHPVENANKDPRRVFEKTANPVFTREESERDKAIAIRVLDQRGCMRRRTPSPGHISVCSDEE